MRKLLLGILLFAAYAYTHAVIADEFVLNTGPGPVVTGGSSVNENQWLAAGFRLDDSTTLDSVMGWIYTSNASNVTDTEFQISIFGDADGLPDERNILYSGSVTGTVFDVPAWTGLSGLEWNLDSGYYWVVLGDTHTVGGTGGVAAPGPAVDRNYAAASWHPDKGWDPRNGWEGYRVIAATDDPPEPVCWKVSGHCYISVAASEITWAEAKTEAELMTLRGARGHLASITSQAEQDFIDTKVLPPQEQEPPFGGNRGWTGGFQAADGGPWEWITGEPFVYTNWRYSSPAGYYRNNFIELNWEVADWNDTANYDRAIDGYLVEFSPQSFVRNLDDVNGDKVTDIAAIRPDGVVIVKDVEDKPVAQFAFTEISGVIDVEVMQDFNGNGSRDLVAIGGDQVTAEVRDGLTGERLSVVHFDVSRGNSPVDLELVPDQNGNGIQELANMNASEVQVEVRDASTGVEVSIVSFSSWFDPVDLEVFPDLDGGGIPELAMLATNDGSQKADKLEVRDMLSGELFTRYLARDWEELQHELVADVNGDGYPEAAILRTHHHDGRNQVILRSLNPNNSGTTGFISIDSHYRPLKLLTIGDISGDGADEVVVFGRRIGGGNQKAQVKSSRGYAYPDTSRRINAVFFDPNFAGMDITSCPDVNGNGSVELVMLGLRSRDGKLRAIVKDALTSELIGKINYD